MKKKYYLFNLLLFFVVILSAQIDRPLYFNSNLKIQSTNGDYVASTLGGLEAPSFNVYDLNKDGKKDLILFDRAGSRILTFINTGPKTNPKYTYKAEFEKIIPPINAWFLMRDMDRDGKEDLVTLSSYNIHGVNDAIIYYKDTGKMGALFGEAIFLRFKTQGLISNLTVNPITLPSITDIDNDGDIDVLDVDIFVGRSRFYKNYAVEKGEPYSTNYYKSFERCWGSYAENPDTNKVIMHASGCDPSANFVRDTFPWLVYNKGKNTHNTNRNRNRRHGGGTSLLLLDKDSDGDYDLVMGNSGFDNLILLNNGKFNTASKYDTIISQDTLFPSETSAARFGTFPAAYYLDIDGDGIKDIIAAPHQVADNAGKNNMFFYKNTGLNNKPNFKLIKKNFIQEQMLDLGSNSKPTFADIDGDGDKDMFISIRDNLKDNDGVCRVYYYENIGSKTNPDFKAKNSDFANLIKYKLKFLSLAFADIDGDNDLDMFIGTSDGSIMYFSNTGTNKNATFSLIKKRWLKIKVNNSATPFFYDVDDDRDLDLIIGQDDGMISYYKNKGTVAKDSMLFITDLLGKMKAAPYIPQGTDTILSNLGNSSPTISTFGTDNLYLISGNESGKMLAWKLDLDNPFDSFPREKLNLKYKVWHNNIFDYSVKTNILHPTIVDINNDGREDIIAGNTAGGLFYWSSDKPVTSIKTNYENAKNYTMYPNPATNKLMFNGKKIIQKIEIYSLLGSKVTSFLVNRTKAQLDISNISNGTYLVKVIGVDNKIWVEPLVVNRGE